MDYPFIFSTQTATSLASSLGASAIMVIGEIAGYLKVTERTIYRLAAAKNVPAFQMGGSRRFPRADIDKCTAKRSEGTATGVWR